MAHSPSLAVANKPRWISYAWVKWAMVILTLAGLAAAATIYRMWPLSPVTLSAASAAVRADLLERWKAGNVVVMIRHAERCDESTNPCMGAADGITWIGHDVAERVGVQFATLDVDNADIFTSPLPRTTQTAQALFHEMVKEQDWLVRCQANMAQDILAHKLAGRNLVLVTHSDCIKRLDAQLGFPHARAVDYSSALFLTVGANGKLQVLGKLNPQDWAQMSLTPVPHSN